jgi:hypothetical protein
MELPSRSRHWVWAVVALVVVLVLAAAGCTKLSGTSSTVSGGTTEVSGATTTATAPTTTAVSASTTTPPASITTPVTTTSSETITPDGHIKACGIIKEVWVSGGVRKLKIDYVDFLVGAAADSAAIADGVIAAGEHVDNDYYVRNNSTKLRTFDVSNSVAITTYSRVDPIDVADPPVSWNTFYDFWNLIGPPLPEDMGMSEGLWWIERDGNTIISIEQQWVP